MSTLQRTKRVASMTNKLVLVRHGESEWNKKNIFTGIRNPDLTDKGVIEARWAGRVLKGEGLRFDVAFTSKLKRAQHTSTSSSAKSAARCPQVIEDAALNERDYGELSGLNKEEARERWGEEQVLAWRRSFDIPPPGGESLKDTAARVQPYFMANVWPHVVAGKNVIVAAHGNFAARTHHVSREAVGRIRSSTASWQRPLRSSIASPRPATWPSGASWSAPKGAIAALAEEERRTRSIRSTTANAGLASTSACWPSSLRSARSAAAMPPRKRPSRTSRHRTPGASSRPRTCAATFSGHRSTSWSLSRSLIPR